MKAVDKDLHFFPKKPKPARRAAREPELHEGISNVIGLSSDYIRAHYLTFREYTVKMR